MSVSTAPATNADNVTANIAGVNLSVDRKTAEQAGGKLTSMHPGYWIAAMTIGIAVYIVERAFPYHMETAVKAVLVPINDVAQKQTTQLEKLDRTVEKLSDAVDNLKDQTKELREVERAARAPVAVLPQGGGS